jgi:hypothetical protein
MRLFKTEKKSWKNVGAKKFLHKKAKANNGNNCEIFFPVSVFWSGILW